MFYVYRDAGRERELLTTALDFLSAQFFAAKFSESLFGPVAIYAAATGRPRLPLAIFQNGVPSEAAPPTLPASAVPPIVTPGPGNSR